MKESAKSNSKELQGYARQWGASAVPFSILSDASWLQNTQIQEAQRHLDQSAHLRSLMVLAGPNGVGKSALVARWARQLETRLFETMIITQATMSANSLMAALVAKFGKPFSCRRERNLALLEEALAELHPRIPVVILDEAQHYSYPALEEVRLLTELNLPERPAFALVLIGDDYFLNTLRLRHYRALFSRIAAHVQLEFWNAQDSAHFVTQGFSAVGIDPTLLEKPALELILSAAGGAARTLAMLSRSAWIEAAHDGKNSISPQHVQRATQYIPCAPHPLDSQEPAGSS